LGKGGLPRKGNLKEGGGIWGGEGGHFAIPDIETGLLRSETIREKTSGVEAGGEIGGPKTKKKEAP